MKFSPNKYGKPKEQSAISDGKSKTQYSRAIGCYQIRSFGNI
jgi:hypothetical protein